MEEKINVKGYAKYDRDISAEMFTSVGQSIFMQSVCTDVFKNSGTCLVKGKCTTKTMTNLGSATMNMLVAEQVNSSGSLQVKKSVKTKTFQAKGHVTIKEELDAQFIDIVMTSTSHIQKISGAKEITIGSHVVSYLNFFGMGKKSLRCSRIEGDVIRLEHTVADLIVGETVYVGKGCHIKEVHYTKDLTIYPGATIGSIHKKGESENEKNL
ncbi:hypothetical protein ABE073_10195 [Lederbergia citrisecunda]|uniref:hypothetical protein n=1 Tax=Lederbergia citrisecunda TaxID=2833583 RepID=UPI003D2821FC